jgi:hypothetical protein
MESPLFKVGTKIPVKQDDVTWGRITYRETALGLMWMAEAKASSGAWIFLGDHDTPTDAHLEVLDHWGLG